MMAIFLENGDARLEVVSDFEVQIIDGNDVVIDTDWHDDSTFNKVFSELGKKHRKGLEISVLDYGKELKAYVTVIAASVKRQYVVRMTNFDDLEVFNIYCIFHNPGEYLTDNVLGSFYTKVQANDVFEAADRVNKTFLTLQTELNSTLNKEIGENYIHLTALDNHENEEGIKRSSEKWNRKYAVLKLEDLSVPSLIEELKCWEPQ